MTGWIAQILAGIAYIFKIIFGLDKPHETEIHNEGQHEALSRPDSELLDDLGVRGFGGTTGKD